MCRPFNSIFSWNLFKFLNNLGSPDYLCAITSHALSEFNFLSSTTTFNQIFENFKFKTSTGPGPGT